MIKKIATWSLLAFAATALVTKIISVNAAQEPTVLPDGNLVVFFHASARCKTCDDMERLLNGVLARQEYVDLEITLVPLESDSAKNRELVEYFRVVGLSLILMERRDGEMVRYDNITTDAWNSINREARFVEMVEGKFSDFYQ